MRTKEPYQPLPDRKIPATFHRRSLAPEAQHAARGMQQASVQPMLKSTKATWWDDVSYRDMRNFHRYEIWNLGKSLAIRIYSWTEGLPKSEKFGLAQQMRRSAVSIPSNIAEGAGRKSNKDFARFIEIALGSSYELETQIILVKELNFLELNPQIENDLKRLQAKMVAFRRRLLHSK